MRGYRDHDQIRTLDGMIFTVVGNVHPPNRVQAYLKYTPSRDGVGCKRILKRYSMEDLEATLIYLSEFAPQHLFHDETLGFEFSGPLRVNVERHFKPEECLERILAVEGDVLERRAAELALELSDKSGVPIENFGVTGSILLGIHHPGFSDLDITVYGRENSRKVVDVLKGLAHGRDNNFNGFSIEDLRRFFSERGVGSALSFEEYANIYRRLWSRGFYKGTFFSVHPVKLESEVDERYGDRVYRQLGGAEAEMVVSDVEDSIFYPAVYGVEDASVREGLNVECLREIISFEGLYCGVASPGERLGVRGVVEEVASREGLCRRMVVGSRGAPGSIRIL